MIDEEELIEKEKKLQEEIEEYNQERDRIKFVIGKIVQSVSVADDFTIDFQWEGQPCWTLWHIEKLTIQDA